METVVAATVTMTWKWRRLVRTLQEESEFWLKERKREGGEASGTVRKVAFTRFKHMVREKGAFTA